MLFVIVKYIKKYAFRKEVMSKNIVYAVSVAAGIFFLKKYTVPSRIWAENYPLLFYVLRGDSLEIRVSQFWVKKLSLAVIRTQTYRNSCFQVLGQFLANFPCLRMTCLKKITERSDVGSSLRIRRFSLFSHFHLIILR